MNKYFTKQVVTGLVIGGLVGSLISGYISYKIGEYSGGKEVIEGLKMNLWVK